MVFTSIPYMACSSGGGTIPAAGATTAEAGAEPGSLVAPPGGLAVAVRQVRQVRAHGEVASPLLIAFEIANGEGGATILLNPLFVEVRFRSGVIKKAVALTQKSPWIDGTVPDATDALASGASYGPWAVGVDVDAQSDPPVELTYTLPAVSSDAGIGGGRQASAQLTLEACIKCADTCTYLDRDPHHCGGCGVHDDSPDIACDKGHLSPCPSGLSRCPAGDNAFACVDLKSDPANCGVCGSHVAEDGRCAEGVPACNHQGETACNGACTYTVTDANNCGSCGNDCRIGAPTALPPRAHYRAPTCGIPDMQTDPLAGKCVYALEYYSPYPEDSCSSICTSIGLTCSLVQSSRGDAQCAFPLSFGSGNGVRICICTK